MYNNEGRGVRRAHSPDIEPNYRQQNFRGRPGQLYHKRHRGDGYRPPQTIEEKIATLGETGSRNVDIGILAKDIDLDLRLSTDTSDDEKITAVTTKICQCIVAFPTRVAAYATLIGLISVKHYNVSCQIINTLHASYPVYLEAQKLQEALTIIHFLSSLVNCKVIRPSALLSQFELILEVTQEENIPQARSDYYVYTVLSSLPFVALELSQQPEQEVFERVLTTIETYLNKRTKAHMNLARIWISSDSTVQMDYLDSLWVQTKNFKANSWIETFLHRPYNDKEYRDIMASSLIPTNSPTIQIPAHSNQYNYPNPRIVLRMFEDDVTDGPKAIPGSDKIERFCIENHVRNIIDELSNEPKDCARHLTHMYRSDSLPMKHILIEVVLGELFTLPKPKHQELLYHVLLFEFSKIFHCSKAPDELKYNYDVILIEAIRTLYNNLETLNPTCFARFVRWLTFHLNATGFLFPWQTWSDATLKEADSPTVCFIRDVLEHCLRFSYYKSFKESAGAHLSNIMPPEPSIENKPVHSDHEKAEELAATVKQLILEKADGKRISETLNILIDGVEMPEDFSLEDEKHIIKLLKIDVFTAVLLFIARISLTHISTAFGKYKNVFKALIAVDGGPAQLMQTIHSCLKTHPQLQVILIDKLSKTGLVNPGQVCDFVFSDSLKEHHIRSYPWEILNNTLTRAISIHKTLLEERNEPKSVKEDSEKDDGGDVTMKQEDDNGASELDDKIKTARESLEELTLRIFRKFANLLIEYIKNCEASQKDYATDNLFKWVAGRMQQIYYENYETTFPLYERIKEIVDVNPSVGGVIGKFC